MIRPPPTSTLFPYTTLFRSVRVYPIGFGTTEPTQMVCTREQLGGGLFDGPGGGFGGGGGFGPGRNFLVRSEEHTSELPSRQYLVCRLLLDKKPSQTRAPLHR